MNYSIQTIWSGATQCVEVCGLHRDGGWWHNRFGLMWRWHWVVAGCSAVIGWRWGMKVMEVWGQRWLGFARKKKGKNEILGILGCIKQKMEHIKKFPCHVGEHFLATLIPLVGLLTRESPCYHPFDLASTHMTLFPARSTHIALLLRGKTHVRAHVTHLTYGLN